MSAHDTIGDLASVLRSGHGALECRIRLCGHVWSVGIYDGAGLIAVGVERDLEAAYAAAVLAYGAPAAEQAS